MSWMLWWQITIWLVLVLVLVLVTFCAVLVRTARPAEKARAEK